MAPRLNFGVLGCANIADRLVIPALISSDTCNLVAIASRDYKKAQLFADKFSCDAIDGYHNLLDRSDIDAVYIPLPVGLHHEWVIKSLDKNKHVLCEKSISTDYLSAEMMVDKARMNSLNLVENFMYRYHSQHKFINNLIDNDEIGELRCFRSSFGFPPFQDDNIRYNKLLGGGSLLDAGAYTINASQMILGSSLEVKSAYLNFSPDKQVDIYGGAFLVSDSGCFSEIAFGFDNYYQCNYEVWGSKGKLISERAFTAGPDIHPKVIIEKQNEKNEFILPADNHFINILKHFHSSIINNNMENNYTDILNQSRLVKSVIDHAIQ